MAGKASVTVPLMIIFLLLMQGSSIMNSYTLVWWQAKYVRLWVSGCGLELTVALQHLRSTKFILSDLIRLYGYISSDIYASCVSFCLSFGGTCSKADIASSGVCMDEMAYFVSKNLHNSAITNIFYAPMSFFDTTVRPMDSAPRL